MAFIHIISHEVLCHLFSMIHLHTLLYTVNGVYVDGVSITLGEPRKHVWIYAIGLNDDFTNNNDTAYGFGHFHCPCSRIAAAEAPVFVGNNYYCEYGNTGGFDFGRLYSDDLLWDGNQCLPGNSVCDRTG